MLHSIKKSILYFFALTLGINTHYSFSVDRKVLPYRDLIMVFDTSEIIDKQAFKDKDGPFGAISQSILGALYQKAAPILVTQPILRTALLPSFIKKNKNTSGLAQLFPFLKTKWGQEILKSNESQYVNFRDAALINFNYNEWIIRQVIMKNGRKDLFLLIPRTYQNISELRNYSSTSSSKPSSITALEFTLGCKIDHMGPVSEDQLYALFKENSKSNEEEIFENFDKEKFFVLNAEYQKAGKELSIPQWNIYLTGHGIDAQIRQKKEPQKKIGKKTGGKATRTATSSKAKNSQEDKLLKELNDIEKYFAQIGKAHEKNGAFAFTPNKGIKLQKEKLKQLFDSLSRIQNTLKQVSATYHKDDVKAIEKQFTDAQKLFATNNLNYLVEDLYFIFLGIKDVTTPQEEYSESESESEDEYSDSESDSDSENEYEERAEESTSGLIAGIPIPEFREFLQFLDKKITVHFFYYSSCYAGGKNLQELYNASLKKITGDTYSFTIALNGFLDAPASVELFKRKGEKLKFDQNFNEYFNQLKDDATNLRTRIEKAVDAVSQLQGSLSQQASDLSHIKFPGNEFVQPIKKALREFSRTELSDAEEKPKFETITEIMATTRKSNNALDINVPIILVYPTRIPFPVNIKLPGKLFTSMVAGEHGKMYHIFNKLNVTVDKKNESDILTLISSAFLGVEALHAEKIFWVKELFVNNKLALQNLFFVYNGTNPQVQKTNYKKMIYYTDARGKEFSAHYTDQKPDPYNMQKLGTVSSPEEYRGEYVKQWENYLSQTFGASYEKSDRDTSALQKTLEARRQGQAPEKVLKSHQYSQPQLAGRHDLDKLAEAFVALKKI